MSERVELLPGVFLRAQQSDKFKTGCLSVNFLRPLCPEEAAANALLPSVLLRGTAQHPDIMAISMLLDELYGAGIGTLIRKRGEVQSFGFYADFIEDAYTPEHEDVLAAIGAFLRELLFAPLLENGRFRAAFVEGEKINLCNAIAAEINEKRSYAVLQTLRIMCRGERSAVPRLGTQAAVEALTPESLYAHYKKVLSDSRVEVLYLGTKQPEQAAALVRAMLAPLPRTALTPVGTEVIRSAGAVKEQTEIMDVTQGRLVLGFRTGCTVGDAEYPALCLLCAVYGGCVTSRLFVNVRERMSLCYDISASLEKFKGLMIVNAGIEFAQFDAAKSEILRQLDACCRGEITDDELEQARTALLSSFESVLDQPGGLDEFYFGQAVGGTPETVEHSMEALRAVSRKQVAAAARRLTLDTVYFLKGVEA